MKLLSRILAFCRGRTPEGRIGMLRFDTSGWIGWKEEERLPTFVVWRHQLDDVLSAALIQDPVDNPPVYNQEALRSYCRNLAARSGAGIVSVDIVEIGGAQALQLIYKREQLPTYIYTGMLVITLGRVEFVLRAVYGEHGTTGVREAFITSQLLKE